jgi:hypothetical protein
VRARVASAETSAASAARSPVVPVTETV